MRLLINILKWTAITITGFMVILFSLSYLLHNKVVEMFLASLNRQISTTVVVDESKLSLIKRFPKAAVELRGVTVFSSPVFDNTQFNNTNTDTLLEARSAILEFSMIDIFNGNYNIESLIIDEGRLNLFSDSSGMVNYEISEGSSSADDDEFVINLDKVIVTGITARYFNSATRLDISGLIENGRFKSRISGNDIDFICSSTLVLSRFDLYSASLKTNASLSIDLSLHRSDSGFTFRKGAMKLEDFRFGLTGFISSSDMMDLLVTGQNIDLARVKKYLPEKYLNKFMEYSPSGILKTRCRIKGYISRKENPEIDLDFSVEKGNVRYSSSNINIKDLSFSGSFTNGKSRRPESSILNIKDLKFLLGSAAWIGEFRLSDLSKPAIALTCSGEVIPAELLRFTTLPEILSAEGSFRLNLNLSGTPGKKDKYNLSDFIDLNPEANIEFNSFGITHKNKDYSISDVDGNIMFAKNLWAEDLVFSYKGQRFKIIGEFTNLPAWLAGRAVRIKAVADISAGNFNPLLLLSDTTASAGLKQEAYGMPAGIEADINFRSDNLVYKNFHAENITGKLIYRPGVAEFKSLRINALDGTAAGEFLIARNLSKSFMTRGNFTFENIDVNLAFKSFNNFGQDFLKAENIAGSLSGNLSILLPMDSLLNPDIKALTAEGKYIIENGKLVDFEPIKALSGFIELSELENISFSRLENDLFIRNNYLAVPQMDIKSSAADFTVNGRHFFDYTYEYHVKTYLSEILSKRAKKGSNYSTEFGAIEEDGLGRTSIYLKITGDNEEIKVGYDMKAAGGNIKQSMKNERSSIKSVLNQEYGWFKGDTTIRQETAPKPKYRIQFSETDTSAVVTDTIPVVEEKGIKSIFRKKKGLEKDY